MSTTIDKLEYEIGSFTLQTQLDYVYMHEGLPLDYLMINQVKVPSEKCESISFDWLNCLQAKSSLPLTRCVDSYPIEFSFGYDDPEGQMAVLVTNNKFPFTVKLDCSRGANRAPTFRNVVSGTLDNRAHTNNRPPTHHFLFAHVQT